MMKRLLALVSCFFVSTILYFNIARYNVPGSVGGEGDHVFQNAALLRVCHLPERDVETAARKRCAKLSVDENSNYMDVKALAYSALHGGAPHEDAIRESRIFTEHGRLLDHSATLQTDTDVFLETNQGRQWIWPSVEIGHVTQPGIRHSPGAPPLTLETISMSPRVFLVKNFLSEDEIDYLIGFAKTRLKRSHVGILKESFSNTRNSKNAWDTRSKESMRIQKRAFNLSRIGFDPTITDAIQIVRYKQNELFNLHTDYFREGYANLDTAKPEGTNRLVTLFIYLNDVESGGHTVFPHSKHHKMGDMYVEKSDHKYTDMPACANKEVLSIKPKRGQAILFYNQLHNGVLDINSEHGGCPLLQEGATKWGANLWIWSNRRPGFGRNGRRKKRKTRPAKSKGWFSTNERVSQPPKTPFSLYLSNEHAGSDGLDIYKGSVFVGTLPYEGFLKVDNVFDETVVEARHGGVVVKRFEASSSKTAITIA
jgi:prolyl 4-hydroxylase